MSTKEVYDKTSNILRAIENCGCTHCIALLKSGLRDQTPEPVRNVNNPGEGKAYERTVELKPI